MTYDELLIEYDNYDLVIKEKNLTAHDGLIKGNKIAIRKSIPTLKQKKCVLAEELGHYCTTVGNILDQSKTSNIKQEMKARQWGYDKVIGLIGIVNAYNANCSNLSEMADFLDVTEDFLQEALNYYRSKYGLYAKVDNYIIYFEPSLAVLELFR